MTTNPSLWSGVDAYLDRLTNPELASAHLIGPLVARRWRQQGRSVAPLLEHEEQLATLANVLAPVLIRRIRASLDGPMMIFKGPEIAAEYPGSARLFSDVDVLVPDARAAQSALRAAGFVEVPDPDGLYVGIHHLIPVWHPSVPLLAVEIHSEPKWPYLLRPPATAELFEAAVPSRCGVADVLAPAHEHHALLLAAHGWEHEPLRHVRDVLDVAVAKEGLDANEIARLSCNWRVKEIWEINCATADALFRGAPRPRAMRIWARHLAAARERTVLENHLERWLSASSGLPLRAGLGHALRRMASDLQPAFDETWPDKLRRTAQAFGHAFYPRSEHNRILGPAAEKGERRNVPQKEGDA